VANVAAHVSASSSTASGSTTRSTSPIDRASDASTILPLNTRSLALDAPTRRASRCVPPPPGMMPRRISGWPNRLDVPAIRRSQASASSQPPPSATPATAAIVGHGIPATAFNAPRKAAPIRATCSGGEIANGSVPPRSANSEMSAPAAKILGPPVSTTTLGVCSVRSAAIACSCSSNSTHNALTLPWRNVTTAMPSSRRSSSTSGSVAVVSDMAPDATAVGPASPPAQLNSRNALARAAAVGRWPGCSAQHRSSTSRSSAADSAATDARDAPSP